MERDMAALLLMAHAATALETDAELLERELPALAEGRRELAAKLEAAVNAAHAAEVERLRHGTLEVGR